MIFFTVVLIAAQAASQVAQHPDRVVGCAGRFDSRQRAGPDPIHHLHRGHQWLYSGGREAEELSGRHHLLHHQQPHLDETPSRGSRRRAEMVRGQPDAPQREQMQVHPLRHQEGRIASLEGNGAHAWPRAVQPAQPDCLKCRV